MTTSPAPAPPISPPNIETSLVEHALTLTQRCLAESGLRSQAAARLNAIVMRSLFGSETTTAATVTEPQLLGRLMTFCTLMTCYHDVMAHIWDKAENDQITQVRPVHYPTAIGVRALQVLCGVYSENFTEFTNHLDEKWRLDLAGAISQDPTFDGQTARNFGYESQLPIREKYAINFRDLLCELGIAAIALGEAANLFNFPLSFSGLLKPQKPDSLQILALTCLRKIASDDRMLQSLSLTHSNLDRARLRLTEIAAFCCVQAQSTSIILSTRNGGNEIRAGMLTGASKRYFHEVAPQLFAPQFPVREVKLELNAAMVQHVIASSRSDSKPRTAPPTTDLFKEQKIIQIVQNGVGCSVSASQLRAESTFRWGNERFHAHIPTQDQMNAATERWDNLVTLAVLPPETKLAPHQIVGRRENEERFYYAFALPGVKQHAYLHCKSSSGKRSAQTTRSSLASGTCIFRGQDALAVFANGQSQSITIPSSDLLAQIRKSDTTIKSLSVTEKHSWTEVESAVRLGTQIRALLYSSGSKIERAHLQIPMEEYILYLAEALNLERISPELFCHWVECVERRNSQVTAAFSRIVTRGYEHLGNRVRIERPLKPILGYLKEAGERGHISVRECCRILKEDDGAWAHFLASEKSWPISPQQLSYRSYSTVLWSAGEPDPDGQVQAIGLYNTQETPLGEQADAQFGKTRPFLFLTSADLTQFIPQSTDQLLASGESATGAMKDYPATPYHLPVNPSQEEMFTTLGQVYDIPSLEQYFSSH